jgi:hypothetical protein
LEVRGEASFRSTIMLWWKEISPIDGSVSMRAGSRNSHWLTLSASALK